MYQPRKTENKAKPASLTPSKTLLIQIRQRTPPPSHTLPHLYKHLSIFVSKDKTGTSKQSQLSIQPKNVLGYSTHSPINQFNETFLCAGSSVVFVLNLFVILQSAATPQNVKFSIF